MKAYELIADKKNWCQGDYWRDENDRSVPFAMPELAVKFCAVGALYKIHPTREEIPIVSEKKKAIQRVLEARGLDPSIQIFNDHHTHEEVVELLREADV